MEAIKIRDNAVDWLKWAGVGIMAIDHLKYIGTFMEWCHYPGRLAYPIFAIICGWNLINNSQNTNKFVLRVGFLGIILYLIQLCTGHIQFNPVITLFLGLFILNCTQIYILIPSAIIILALGNFTGQIAYGVGGVALVILGGLLAKCRTPHMVLICGLVAATLNNGNIGNSIAAIGGLATATILVVGINKSCPIQNSKWLYLAFPASMLPAIISYVYINK